MRMKGVEASGLLDSSVKNFDSSELGTSVWVTKFIPPSTARPTLPSANSMLG